MSKTTQVVSLPTKAEEYMYMKVIDGLFLSHFLVQVRSSRTTDGHRSDGTSLL